MVIGWRRGCSRNPSRGALLSPVPTLRTLVCALGGGDLKTTIDHNHLALFIAALVLVLTLWQGFETRQHNRVSVVPRLNGDISTSKGADESRITYVVESSGLGPAKVTRFSVYHRGQEQPAGAAFNRTMADLQEALGERSVELGIEASELSEGSFLAPGDSEVLFVARAQSDEDASDVVDHVLGTLAIGICYCSVYDDQCRHVSFGQSETSFECSN